LFSRYLYFIIFYFDPNLKPLDPLFPATYSIQATPVLPGFKEAATVTSTTELPAARTVEPVGGLVATAAVVISVAETAAVGVDQPMKCVLSNSC
jgi:hypothetical protein